MSASKIAKQAIFPNGSFAVPKDDIAKWKGFMRRMETRHIPVSLHSDLGNDSDNTKFLPLMYVNDEAFKNIALGQNYFNILDMRYKAPDVCLYKLLHGFGYYNVWCECSLLHVFFTEKFLLSMG